MTENDWLTALDPDGMREYLRLRELASERKLRLFAAAACRRIWHLLSDERSRRAVEVAERYADGLASTWEVQAAEQDAASAVAAAEQTAAAAHLASILGLGPGFTVGERTLASIAAEAASTAAEHPFFLNESARFSADALSWHDSSRQPDPSRRAAERAFQAALIRDIFPNPFRPTPSIGPQVLAWNDGCVVKLASSIYLDRDFGPARMGVLVDALEEVGVTDTPILGHGRDARAVHVRGCWLIDLLLAK
jgi:hypothetical protein